MEPRPGAATRRRGETFSLDVPKWMFDFMEKVWEPPTPAEMRAYNGEYAGS